MTEKTFFEKYAEGILGRSLKKKESEQLLAEDLNRRKVRDLCAVFAQSKPKSKKKDWVADQNDEPMSATIEKVVNNEV